MNNQPSTLSYMYPMLLMSGMTMIPQLGFGIYDRIEAKRKENEQKQQLSQWYSMQNQGIMPEGPEWSQDWAGRWHNHKRNGEI